LIYTTANYPQQFYDRKDRVEQADALVLRSGVNRLTTRLRATRLINRLLDDITGLPIRNTAGTVEVYSGTKLLDQQFFRTDSGGVYTVTLSTYREQAVQLGYRANGYPYQFYDRQTLLEHATPLMLHN